jgi:hypothetical protein
MNKVFTRSSIELNEELTKRKERLQKEGVKVIEMFKAGLKAWEIKLFGKDNDDK